MHRDGHFGIGFAIAAIAIAAGGPVVGGLFGGAVVATSLLPDKDHTLPFISHRGFTHTVAFGLVVGIFLAVPVFFGLRALATRVDLAATLPATYSVLVEPSIVAGLVGGGAALGVIGHVAGDALTVGSGTYGVRPLWPLSRWEFRLGLCRADNMIANYGLLGAGVAALLGALYLRMPIA